MFMKQKKKLTDNQRLARNKKIKRVIKIVLDVLIYGFAFFMLFGLILGSCSVGKQASKNNTKNDLPPISRALNTPGGYVTSINEVPIVDGGETKFYYYYDSNYVYTFPGHSALLSAGMTSDITLYSALIYPAIDVDNIRYVRLAFYRSDNTYALRLYGNSIFIYTDLMTISLNNKTILRADLFSQVFNGNYVVRLGDSPSTTTQTFYRFIYYYFGEFGLNRLNYDFPMNPTQYNDLFISSTQENQSIMGGLLFKNDNFPDTSTQNVNQAIVFKVPMFSGAFRSGGVVYSGIYFNFATVFGNRYINSTTSTPYMYHFPLGVDIVSTDTYYRGYWFLESIEFVNSSTNTIAWKAFNYNGLVASKLDMSYVGTWVGDTYTSTSPYRSAYIFYFLDSVSSSFNPYGDLFPLLVGYNFARFYFYIGEAYVNTLPGGIVNNESPIITNVFSWFSSALTGLLPVFGYTFVPGITFGTLLMIPFSVTIVLFVIRLFKR